jgi:putative pyruvate formate lyase activating enzyme
MDFQPHQSAAVARPGPTAAELGERLARARAGLTKCELCEWRCGARRATGERGRCGLAAETRVFRTEVGAAELAAGRLVCRLYLGGCNFRCAWCNTAPAAFADEGWLLEARECAAELAVLSGDDMSQLELTGGEPTLHVYALLALALASPRPLRMTLNSNMYMAAEVLELLAGLVTRYIADFKFGNDACAERLAGVPRYGEVVRRNLLHAAERAEVVVRHLLVPGHLDCCFHPVVNWTAEHLPGAQFQLCPGYLPHGAAAVDAQVGRLNARAEVESARTRLKRLGLRGAELAGPSVQLPRLATVTDSLRSPCGVKNERNSTIQGEHGCAARCAGGA